MLPPSCPPIRKHGATLSATNPASIVKERLNDPDLAGTIVKTRQKGKKFSTAVPDYSTLGVRVEGGAKRRRQKSPVTTFLPSQRRRVGRGWRGPKLSSCVTIIGQGQTGPQRLPARGTDVAHAVEPTPHASPMEPPWPSASHHSLGGYRECGTARSSASVRQGDRRSPDIALHQRKGHDHGECVVVDRSVGVLCWRSGVARRAIQLLRLWQAQERMRWRPAMIPIPIVSNSVG